MPAAPCSSPQEQVRARRPSSSSGSFARSRVGSTSARSSSSRSPTERPASCARGFARGWWRSAAATSPASSTEHGSRPSTAFATGCSVPTQPQPASTRASASSTRAKRACSEPSPSPWRWRSPAPMSTQIDSGCSRRTKPKVSAACSAASRRHYGRPAGRSSSSWGANRISSLESRS